jgi:hypothetical protein
MTSDELMAAGAEYNKMLAAHIVNRPHLVALQSSVSDFVRWLHHHYWRELGLEKPPE